MTRLEDPTLFEYVFYRVVNAIHRRLRSLEQTAEYLAHYPRFGHLGENVVFDDDVTINRPCNVSIGDDSFVGRGVTLNAVDDIVIGDHVLIAAGSRLMTWNHVISDRSIDLDAQGKKSAPIRIRDGTWLGYDTIILPGVTVGEGAVIGAGAVVTDDVDGYAVVGGVPAKQLGKRTDDGINWED